MWHSTSKYRRVIWQCNNKVKQLQQLVLQLEKADTPIDTFDESLWRTMIEKVMIFHDNKMIVQFLDGTEIEA